MRVYPERLPGLAYCGEFPRANATTFAWACP
jgi:hypothetical protein